MDKARRLLKHEADVALVARTLELPGDARVLAELAARFGVKNLSTSSMDTSLSTRSPTLPEALHAYR
jgi:hypothetical protein